MEGFKAYPKKNWANQEKTVKEVVKRKEVAAGKARSNVLILVVFDRSGSMGQNGKIVEARNGYNNFIKDQKALPGNADVTLAIFDDKYDIMYNAMDINRISELKEGRIRPRGMTRLYDAIGKTINSVDDSKYDGVIVLVTTDGDENDSREYTSKDIKKLVSAKKRLGWEIIFSGTTESSVTDSKKLGVTKSYVYVDNGAGQREAWGIHGGETMCYRASSSTTVSATDVTEDSGENTHGE